MKRAQPSIKYAEFWGENVHPSVSPPGYSATRQLLENVVLGHFVCEDVASSELFFVNLFIFPMSDEHEQSTRNGNGSDPTSLDGVSDKNSSFAALLLQNGLVNKGTLDQALIVATAEKRLVLDVLVERGDITIEANEAITALAKAIGKADVSNDIASDAEMPSPGQMEALDIETLPPNLNQDTATIQSGDSPSSTATHLSLTGSSPSEPFGDYEIFSEIARGGMGVVYKARQITLDRTVALKKVLSGQLASDEDIKRFQIEAEASANLDHPGIVPVYDFGQAEGQFYFSMGFVEGKSLADRIVESPLEPRPAAKLLIKISRAVAYANEQGVIHRDLKPGNVLLDNAGEPRVTDFGLAKKSSENSGMTATGQILGTPSYMPPEQAAGHSDQVDQRADVYALGAILYAMLTGRPPFQAANPMETLSQVLRRDAVPIRQLVPAVPRDLETICLKALRKEIDKRYDSANDLADDLQRWLDHEPIVARRVNRSERAWKWCKRKPMVVASAATIVTLLVVGSLIFWERHNAAFAEGRVDALLKAKTARVNEIIGELDGYGHWANGPLRETFQTSSPGGNAKLHTGMALASHDTVARSYLADQLLLTSPTQFAFVRDALSGYVTDEQIVEYWAIAQDPYQDANLRFQAACAVASFDTDAERWNDSEFQIFVATHLVSVLPTELQPWQDALSPVKEKLVEPLKRIYRDISAGDNARSFATDTLAEYLSDDVDGLFELLADANLSQFPPMFARIRNFQPKAIELAEEEIAMIPDNDADPTELDRCAVRQANAAILLFRLDAPDRAWKLFQHSHNPQARSYLIHWLSPLEVQPQTLISRFELESDVTAKRALLLSLGEFNEFQLSVRARESLIDLLCRVYRDDPDAGLHAAVNWLLRRWGRADSLDVMDLKFARPKQPRANEEADSKQWYVNGQGQTFVIINAGEFMMGSPETETGRDPKEFLHRHCIDRSLAISATEVTKAQFREFAKGKQGVISADTPQLAKVVLTENSPMTGVSWYEAAAYCNWLSEQEGMPESEWVYETNAAGEYGPGMRAKERFWELTGYRLPTSAEWEFACRANTSTSRYFGNSESLLGEYARYLENAESHLWDVAERKPNDIGLFGMHGNAFEWCFDEYVGNLASTGDTAIDAPTTLPLEDAKGRILRGGAFSINGPNTRAASRFVEQPNSRQASDGFRVFRTYKLEP